MNPDKRRLALSISFYKWIISDSSLGRFRLRGAGGAVLRGVAALEEEALPLLSAVGDVVGVEVAVGVIAALDAARVLVQEVEEEDVDDVQAVHVARVALLPPGHASRSHQRRWKGLLLGEAVSDVGSRGTGRAFGAVLAALGEVEAFLLVPVRVVKHAEVVAGRDGGAVALETSRAFGA